MISIMLTQKDDINAIGKCILDVVTDGLEGMAKNFINNSTTAVEQNTFPDGTLNIKLPYEKDELFRINWYYESDSELFTLMCIKNYFSESKDVQLFMPYIPNARMDRVKDKGDVFTLKYFADIINSLNFSFVITYDAHSNVSEALFNNINNIFAINMVFKNTIEEKIAEYQEKINSGYIATMGDPLASHEPDNNFMFFFPDEGAMKRYSDKVNLPYTFGVKNRDWKTGEIKSLEIMNKNLVKGKQVFIVDDICSKGGTFYHSAKALKEAGANRVDLFVTHCEKSIFDGELLKTDYVDHIYTTDSIFKGEHEKITVFKLSDVLY